MGGELGSIGVNKGQRRQGVRNDTKLVQIINANDNDFAVEALALAA